MSLMDKMKKMMNSINGTNFFKTGNGKQTVRILDGPDIYMAHYVRKMDGYKKTVCKGHHCSICKKGNPREMPVQRALFVVLDRFDGEVKWFETGANVLKQINELVAYNHISFKTDDIVIQKNYGLPMTQYTILPGTEGLLTDEEVQKFNEFMSEKDLDKQINSDICIKCGSLGTQKGTACICDSCGNIIWGI